MTAGLACHGTRLLPSSGRCDGSTIHLTPCTTHHQSPIKESDDETSRQTPRRRRRQQRNRFAIASVALALAQGARVTILGRSATKLADAAVRLGGKAVTVQIDLGDAASAQAGFTKIDEFDYFVSTAADPTYDPLASMNRVAIGNVLAGKFWARSIWCSTASADSMQVDRCCFSPDWPPIVPEQVRRWFQRSTRALKAWARALAVELAPVRVDAISPGVVETKGWSFVDEASRKAFFADLATKLPARKVGAPEDLAKSAFFMLTNPYLTGEVLHVNDGGSLT
ncbi:MAG: SDR family oxidoreductase [Janthinobacterium lividum]